MQEKLLAIKEAAFNEIAAAENSGALEEIRVKYLGKKGELTTILRGMGSLTPAFADRNISRSWQASLLAP